MTSKMSYERHSIVDSIQITCPQGTILKIGCEIDSLTYHMNMQSEF